MTRCKVCGSFFRLLAKNRYEVKMIPEGIAWLTSGVTYYNAFDCPKCGCQNLYGPIIKNIIKNNVEFENGKQKEGKENE